MTLDPDILRALQQKNMSLLDENRALREEVHRLRHAIRALTDLQDSLQNVNRETDVFSLINRILYRALDAVDSENGSLLLLDPATQELVFVEVQGPFQEMLKGYRLAPGEGIAGWVIANRQAALVPDVHGEPRFSPTVDQATGFRTTSLICVPLIYLEQIWGAIEVVNTRSGRPFTEEDLDIMLLVARLAAQLLARAEQVVATSEPGEG